jgi:deoxyribonuclease V
MGSGFLDAGIFEKNLKKDSEDFMIACADVHYRIIGAIAACILFKDWTDGCSMRQIIESVEEVKPYEPGRFYMRELPCLLCVLSKVQAPLDAVVIDGYVWLGDEGSPGLGAYLYGALGESIPIIGVAKSRFKDSDAAQEVFRAEANALCTLQMQEWTRGKPPIASGGCTANTASPPCSKRSIDCAVMGENIDQPLSVFLGHADQVYIPSLFYLLDETITPLCNRADNPVIRVDNGNQGLFKEWRQTLHFSDFVNHDDFVRLGRYQGWDRNPINVLDIHPVFPNPVRTFDAFMGQYPISSIQGG